MSIEELRVTGTDELTLPSLSAPAELVALPGGPFRLWPVGSLRAAGFPFAPLLALGDPDYAAAADRLIAARDKAAGRKTGELRRVTAEFEQATEAAQARQERVLVDVSRQPDFQEAVAWQNHAILEQVVIGLADAPRNKKLRQRLRVVARYWSRYAAKNDTIGFFGPVGWFTVDERDDALTIRPGERVDRDRVVAFENWPIDRLAALAAADPAVKPWIAPRRNPSTYLDGNTLRHLAGPPVPLDVVPAHVVRLCDGERTALAIARELIADERFPFTEPEQVFGVLGRLAEHQVIYWDLEQPLHADPDRLLRTALHRIDDPAVHATALAPLDELDAARTQVAEAGSAVDLHVAMTELETRFERLTGDAGTHNAGQTYGERGIVYMDATRDLDARIGAPLLASFGPALSILLRGARWLTGDIARRHHEIFLETYEKLLAGQNGEGPVDLVSMLHIQGAALTDKGNRPLERAVEELTERFGRLLGLDADTARIEHDTGELAARATEIFGDPQVGWAHAHIHSVDVQVAAPDVEAVERGEATCVLGEIHLAWNPMEGTLFAGTYPHEGYLAELMRTSYPQPRIMLCPLKGTPRLTTRTAPGVHNPDDWWLSVGPHTEGAPDRQLALAAMIVERDGDRLIVTSRDGGPRFDFVDIGGIWLAWDIMDSFKLVASDRPHTPRVTVGGLVVCRESWTASLDELTFADEPDEAATFLAARRWASELGLPRHLFAKLSSEMKPFYVDLTSPVLVGSLASSIRASRDRDGHARTLGVSEMLPGPEEIWLPDADGNRYTSELRLAVIDPLD